MIILLDTSTPVCKIVLIDNQSRHDYELQLGRTLARNLLSELESNIRECNKSWQDIKGIGVYRGPGSFTGLRIGITVANTIADAQSIPIIGGFGDCWQAEAIDAILTGKNDKIVLPFYGREANVTTPRK